MDKSKNRPQFGDTAIRLGYLSDEQVRSALTEQTQRRKSGGSASPIGSLLQEKGLLTPLQIAAVLRQLAGSEVPLSEDGIRLAARLKVLHAGAGNVIGITSTVPADAARTTVELAVALAVMGQGKVLVVDANVRAPSLHALLDLPAAPGLSTTFLSARPHRRHWPPAWPRSAPCRPAARSPTSCRCACRHKRRS